MPGSDRGGPLIGLTVVRNEGDIIGQVLRHAARNHDLILVVDVCSWDDTVSEIEAVSREHPHVVLITSLPTPTFAERTWRHIWDRFRTRVPAGTWWSYVDGDEFTDHDLRHAVARAESEGADHIEGASALFFYTESEARAWHEGREGLADRARSIEERRTRYRMYVYSVRLFRQSPHLRWLEDVARPRGLVRNASRRVDYRHDQDRDLDQIGVRLRTRREPETPDGFARQHYHWFYDEAKCITADDTPRLLTHRVGAELEADPDLPKVWVPGPHVRATRWVRERLYAARNPQPPPGDLLADVDVDGALARARFA